MRKDFSAHLARIENGIVWIIFSQSDVRSSDIMQYITTNNNDDNADDDEKWHGKKEVEEIIRKDTTEDMAIYCAEQHMDGRSVENW